MIIKIPMTPTKKQKLKLFLFDGNAFCYRAFYAIPAMNNSRGEATNAIFGFISMTRKIIATYKPDAISVCFDRKEPTFRHEKYKEYKAHRKPMPDDLVSQMEPIREYCELAGYLVLDKAGFEADDLLGTLAVEGKKKNYDVTIVTGDKDALQLVEDGIHVLNPGKVDLLYDADKVKKRFDGVGPKKIVELMALMGDSSDNIPGVPGIGQKTGIKLIKEFGNVENLIKGVENLKGSRECFPREREWGIHEPTPGLSGPETAFEVLPGTLSKELLQQKER